MFDQMTLTKVVGGFCGAFLVFLLGNWAADSIYGGGESHGAEGEQAYTIATAEAEGATGEEVASVDINVLLAAADVAAGEKTFGKCKACHKLDGGKGTGPALNGVIGRDIGSFADFAYTGVLTELPGNWDPQAFSDFLADPKKYAPGTKMNIKLAKPEDRANLIAFLQSKP
jgi:cytochrome c